LIGDRRDAPQTVARGDHLVLSSLTFAFGELYPLALAWTENATAATTHRRSPRCGLGR
jgi:hypothetical protein